MQQLDVALPGNTYCERKTQLIIDSTLFLFASEEHVESILISFAVLRNNVISDILLFLHATRKKNCILNILWFCATSQADPVTLLPL